MKSVFLIELDLEDLPMIMAMRRNIEEGGMIIIPMGEATTMTKDITKRPSLNFLM